MEKIEYRAVIKFLYLKGKTPTEIKGELLEVYGECAPSFSTIKTWAAEFKRGRTSIFDEDRSGRPKTATTDEIVEKVHQIVMEDRRLKLDEIAEASGISHERAHNILHEHLGMRKLTARWVPRFLTIEHKRVRVNFSKECLERFKCDTIDFLHRFVTVDEIWIHHYNTSEIKEQQSKRGKTDSEPVQKKTKTTQSAGKVMATVFWDAHGILLIDYTENGKPLTGEYYASLLQRLETEIKQKRPHMANKKILFHHDRNNNETVHTAPVALAKLNQLEFELIHHPPNSPDLAPCDFFLFPNLKKWLSGKKFLSNAEVIDAVDAYFNNIEQSYFTDGMTSLEKRWTQCIELKGDYVEK